MMDGWMESLRKPSASEAALRYARDTTTQAEDAETEEDTHVAKHGME